MRKTIEIAASDGTRPRIRATVYGALAIHEDVGHACWTVTHVPSGRALAWLLSSQDAAKLIVGALLTMGVDWRPVAPIVTLEQREEIITIRDTIGRAIDGRM